MTAREDQPQALVGDLVYVVRQFLQRPELLSLLRFDCSNPLTSETIDRSVPGRGDDPPRRVFGIPRVGQVRSASTNASWTASSARSKLPVARIRAATARPASRRNRRSMSRRVSAVASALRLIRELLDRTQLYRAVDRAGATASSFDRVVDIGDI